MNAPTPVDITTKAKVLLEALPYIRRFSGSVFVVKYGGSFMDDPDPILRSRVANDIACLATVGIRVVVVHGGGKAITRAMDKAGLPATFSHGYRVTTREAVAVVEATLNRCVNPEICTMISKAHGDPVGVPGQAVLTCSPMKLDVDGEAVDLGYVGAVQAVDTAPILRALEAGQTPVVSPIARGADGQFYNTNADVAAGHVAGAMKARRLVYLCDVPGLMRDPANPDSLISTLAATEVAGLKADGTIASGMLPKVDSAVAALRQGVHRVHFIDGRMPHSLLLEIFTDRGIGTEIIQPKADA
ncbi:MAG: acetylglutamate kinase [Opitutales bacterium]